MNKHCFIFFVSNTESEDYIVDSFLLVFSTSNVSTQMLCRNISVLADDVVESMEDILLVLNTSDPAIVITQPNVIVYIEDSSCKCFLIHMI